MNRHFSLKLSAEEIDIEYALCKIVSLIIGFKGQEPTVFFNGVRLNSRKNVDLAYIPGIGLQPDNYVDDETVCLRYIIPTTALYSNSQEIEFECNAESEIYWIEIDVI